MALDLVIDSSSLGDFQPRQPSHYGAISPPATASSGFLIVVRSALPGSVPEAGSSLSVSEVTPLLQQLAPERHQGDLSNNIRRISDLRVSSALPALFALAAFFASNNNLDPGHMDTFLGWVITQRYEESLIRFMRIQSPTIHAFAKVLLESAIRTESVPMLNALLDCGVNLDSKLLGIASIGDIPLTWRVLSNVDHASLAGDDGANLLHHFVSQRQFDLAQHFLSNGVSADA
jgi:hypothetical protein